jgi:hypothetical protein
MPFGEEDIIQTSLAKTNLSRDVFMSHISIGHDKKFYLLSHNNGGDLLRIGFDLWVNKLKYTLSKICTEMNVPNNMFIIANSIVSDILTKELSSIVKNKTFEMLGSKVEVSVIKEGVINSLMLNGQILTNEPYIKMDLIFLDKLLKH